MFYVNHTVTTPKVNGKAKIVAKDRAKTKSSLRALPLDEMVKTRLLEHKERQEMYRKNSSVRHTCASRLLNKGEQNGITLKDIQVWLGHSDFSTTANIYAGAINL